MAKAHINFLDLEKAFDFTYRYALWYNVDIFFGIMFLTTYGPEY